MGGIYATPRKYVTDCDRWWQSAQHIPIHLLEMASISVGSKDSILLQQSGRDVFKEVWTYQHRRKLKFSLAAENQEVSLGHDWRVW